MGSDRTASFPASSHLQRAALPPPGYPVPDRKPASDCRNLDPADLQARYDALVGRYGLRVYDASLPFEDLASALVHDALSTYMATFGPLLRSLFFDNPWQLNPPGRESPHDSPDASSAQ